MTHPELIAARRAISIAKLVEFDGQCWRIAALVRAGVIDLVDAVDALYGVAEANDLTSAHGPDFVTEIMSCAFADADRAEIGAAA